jgi:hypothetical protein
MSDTEQSETNLVDHPSLEELKRKGWIITLLLMGATMHSSGGTWTLFGLIGLLVVVTVYDYFIGDSDAN